MFRITLLTVVVLLFTAAVTVPLMIVVNQVWTSSYGTVSLTSNGPPSAGTVTVQINCIPNPNNPPTATVQCP